MSSIGADPLTAGLEYFAISTQGPWHTAASQDEYDILIDTNGDGVPDAVIFNTRFTGTDIFVSATEDLQGNILDVEPTQPEPPTPLEHVMDETDTWELFPSLEGVKLFGLIPLDRVPLPRWSGVVFFSQSALGTVPNIAPPSSARNPSHSEISSRFPSG